MARPRGSGRTKELIMPASHVIAATFLTIALGALIASLVERLRSRGARRDLIAYILYRSPDQWNRFPHYARRFFAGALLSRLARTALASDPGFAIRYTAAQRPARRTLRLMLVALLALLVSIAAYRWSDILRFLGLTGA